MKTKVGTMEVCDKLELNQSGIEPVGRAVLVEPYEPEIKKSVIHMPDQVAERTAMVETRAVVLAIGAHAWNDEPSPRCKVGDKVMLTKFAGVMVKAPDGKVYRMVNDRDIYCRLLRD